MLAALALPTVDVSVSSAASKVSACVALARYTEAPILPDSRFPPVTYSCVSLMAVSVWIVGLQI